MEKEIEELKKEIKKIKQELEKIKQAIKNHRHDGHGFTISDL